MRLIFGRVTRAATSPDCRLLRQIQVVALSILAVMATPAFASADSPAPPPSARAPEIRLPGKKVTLPIVMMREFPFIEGEIAGVKGKLMLDTGMQDGLVINDHRVLLKGGTKIGTGHFGSGQTFDIQLHAAVPEIRIGNLHHPRATNVRSQDARMLENITPDFLGWVGFNFFADHAIKIDYRRMEVTFYEAGEESFVAGEKVIAILAFETRKLPNIPVLSARIGDLDAIVTLDTGMYGSLSIPEGKKARLIASGHLKQAPDPDTHDLSGVRLADVIDGSFPALEVEEGPSPSAKSVGITEDIELELGFVFLRNYKTVWDYRRKRIYLLAP